MVRHAQEARSLAVCGAAAHPVFVNRDITRGDRYVNRQVISTAAGTGSGSPYSPAIRFDNLLFVSGQVALTPAGAIGPEGIEEQTRLVLENLRTILDAAGSSLERVLKTTCFLTNIDDFATFNRVYKTYFPIDPPARSTCQVAGLAPGLLIEIDAIAAVD
jgi:2-iminobutanoate/2-iminopropanoate deaminase